MGGTYWYFYRLDGELEQHDPVEPSTTACPLLPGQQVNVLEVPIQLQQENELGHRSRTLLDSAVFTLDPKAKYSSPRPSIQRNDAQKPDSSLSIAPSTSRPVDLHHNLAHPATHSTSSTSTLQPLERARPSTNQGPCIAFPKASSFMAVFHRMRGTRSAPSTNRAGAEKAPRPHRTPWQVPDEVERYKTPAHRETFTDLLSSRIRAPVNTPEWPLAAAPTNHVPPWKSDPSIDQLGGRQESLSITSHSLSEPSAQKVTQSRSLDERVNDLTGSIRPEDQPLTMEVLPSAHETHPDQADFVPDPVAAGPKTASADFAREDKSDAQRASLQSLRIEEDHLNSVNCAASPLVLPIQSNAQSSESLPNNNALAAYGRLKRSARPPSLLYDDRETLVTFYAASSSFDGPLSPHYLSQPESPSVRDFDEAWETGTQTRAASQEFTSDNPPLASDFANGASPDLLKMSRLPSPGFQGYSLPKPEYASTLTLRKPASAKLSAAQELSNNENLVQSWNDGSAHGHVTALDELVDDLGYLGQVIV
ncbi:MAG: hypothetical protein Q9225_005945 [Loekoesia sp. 1 TL-2023]